MAIVFGILAIILALALILVVVIQNSKGGGLSSAFGASSLSNVVGARRSAQEIEKITWWLIGIVMVVAFVANVSFKTKDEVEKKYSVEEIVQESINRPTNKVTAMPAIPESKPLPNNGAPTSGGTSPTE